MAPAFALLPLDLHPVRRWTHGLQYNFGRSTAALKLKVWQSGFVFWFSHQPQEPPLPSPTAVLEPFIQRLAIPGSTVPWDVYLWARLALCQVSERVPSGSLKGKGLGPQTGNLENIVGKGEGYQHPGRYILTIFLPHFCTPRWSPFVYRLLPDVPPPEVTQAPRAGSLNPQPWSNCVVGPAPKASDL